MPTAVESIANLGAVLVQLPQAPASHVIFEPNDNIGGRSNAGHGLLLPAVHHANNALPAVQSQAVLIALLRGAMPGITAALAKTLPANSRNVEVLGVGTESGIIAILIGLLRSHGYHATLGACDGSVRPGFSGPTAVIRAQGTSTVPQLFLQQIAANHASSPYG